MEPEQLDTELKRAFEAGAAEVADLKRAAFVERSRGRADRHAPWGWLVGAAALAVITVLAFSVRERSAPGTAKDRSQVSIVGRGDLVVVADAGDRRVSIRGSGADAIRRSEKGPKLLITTGGTP